MGRRAEQRPAVCVPTPCQHHARWRMQKMYAWMLKSEEPNKPVCNHQTHTHTKTKRKRTVKPESLHTHNGDTQTITQRFNACRRAEKQKFGTKMSRAQHEKFNESSNVQHTSTRRRQPCCQCQRSGVFAPAALSPTHRIYIHGAGRAMHRVRPLLYSIVSPSDFEGTRRVKHHDWRCRRGRQKK